MRDFTTTEKDKQKGITNFPLEEFRLYNEDLLASNSGSNADSKAKAGDQWTVEDIAEQM